MRTLRTILLAPIAILTLATIANLITPNTARAVVPPDSCFVFNVATGAITEYGDDSSTIPRSIGTCPTDVDIPSTIGGVTATSITANVFREHGIVSATLPGTITYIGDYAFYGNQLTSIDIPPSVNEIGMSAFQNNQIDSLTITPDTTQLLYGAFAGNKLKAVTLYNGVKYSPNVFAYNEINDITVEDGVDSISNGIFKSNQL